MRRTTGFFLSSVLRRRARGKKRAAEYLIQLREKKRVLLKSIEELQRRGVPVKVPKLNRGGFTRGTRIANLEEDISRLQEAIRKANLNLSKEQKEKPFEEKVKIAKSFKTAVSAARTEEEIRALAEDLVEGRISEKEVQELLKRMGSEERDLFKHFVNLAQAEALAKKIAYGQELSSEEQRVIESFSKDIREHFEFSREFYMFVQDLLKIRSLAELSEEDAKFYEWIKKQPYWLKKLEKALKERAE